MDNIFTNKQPCRRLLQSRLVLGNAPSGTSSEYCQVNMLSMVYMAAYLFVGFFASWSIDHVGLRFGVCFKK
jgi:uncharacterized protein YcsI (UPF0317 family)